MPNLAALPMPASGSGLPDFIDGDIRPMMNLHGEVGLFVLDDTGVDYAAVHLCTRVPDVAITKTPTTQQFNTGDPTTFNLTVANHAAVATTDDTIRRPNASGFGRAAAGFELSLIMSPAPTTVGAPVGRARRQSASPAAPSFSANIAAQP